MLFRVVLVVLSFVVWGFSQTCRLDWSQDQSCISIEDLNGKNLSVPANVTRFGDKPLQLCPLQSQSFSIPAVIFVMDQSASMDSTYVSNGSIAGDPLHWRASLVRNAISYLDQVTQGQGWFSYIEFADTVLSSLVPEHKDCIDGWNGSATRLLSEDFMELTASNLAEWTDSEGPVQNRCQTGTNYFAALDQAKRYAVAFDPGDANVDVSVIFISDGQPSRQRSDTYKPLEEDYKVPGVFPPVHGIYLGAAQTDGGALAQVADRTNGSYNVVAPGDTAAMNAVMNEILNLVAKSSFADSVIMNINGVSYVGVQEKQPDGNTAIRFPANMPLAMGKNSIIFRVKYKDSEGLSQTYTSVFSITVGGTELPEGNHEVNDIFNATCVIEDKLVVNGWLNPRLVTLADLASTPHISPLDSQVVLELHSFSFSGSETKVQVRSRRSQELDSISLKLLAPGLFGGVKPFDLVRPNRMGRIPKAPEQDGKLSFAPYDTLDFRWRNPEDIRDTLVGSLLLYAPSQLAFSQDTLPIDQIDVMVQDYVSAGVSVPVSFTWLDGTPLPPQNLVRVDSSQRFRVVANMKADLQARTDKAIIATYEDPVFGQIVADTAWLIFETPVLPVAWMLDFDGDGQAETLRLTYTETPTKSQSFVDYALVWGNRNQDTVIFAQDSAHPLLAPADGSYSIDTVHTAAGVQWTFHFTQPLPFGHTSGSGLSSEGMLYINGWFDGNPVSRVIPLLDKVGPVLTEIWVDAVEPYQAYFRLSEPAKILLGAQWMLSKHPGESDSERQWDSVTVVDTTRIYTMYLTQEKANRILGGDSARLVFVGPKGVRDLAGNAAHPNNPYALVRGKTGTQLDFEVDYAAPLIDKKFNGILPPSPTKGKNEFRVLVPSEAQGNLMELATGQSIDRGVLQSMPALLLDMELPHVTGLGSDGSLIDGQRMDGHLVYKTVVRVAVLFYDQGGQFIVRKEAEIPINDSTESVHASTGKYLLLWETDSEKGLTTSEGRSVANGVLLSKVTVFIHSTATMNIDLYDEQGALSEHSIREGDALVSRDDRVLRLGYRRAP